MDKRFLIITTGGTIAGNVALTSNIDMPKNELSDLNQILQHTLKRIEEDWKFNVTIDSHPIANVDSSDILPEHWEKISDTVRDNYDKYSGFIVTHGTNTMGYTCAALSYALDNLNKPVVVTGSQVPFGWPGSDALMNLDNAIRVAAWPHEGGIRGVVCVFGSHIITGTRAKKSTEFDYDAFQSFSSGSLGRIGRIIQINKSNLQKHHTYLQREGASALQASELIVKNKFDMRLLSFTEFPGMDPNTFMYLLKSLTKKKTPTSIRGLVFRAFGAGDVSTHLHECFRYLKDNEIPVVVTTQAPNGNSNFKVNEPGQKLEKEGLGIPAFDMSIESITTKLAWLNGQELSYEKIKSKMLEDLHGEITKSVEQK